jgi:Ran GTPase-activating protein (RanGAP) involved in mRNA processing and transport
MLVKLSFTWDRASHSENRIGAVVRRVRHAATTFTHHFLTMAHSVDNPGQPPAFSRRPFECIHGRYELDLSGINNEQAKQIAEELAINTTLKECKNRWTDGRLLPRAVRAINLGILYRRATDSAPFDMKTSNVSLIFHHFKTEAVRPEEYEYWLSLRSCRICVEGAMALAHALTQNTRLSVLKLTHSHIANDVAAALADGLKRSTGLRALHLDNNNIGNDGASALADGLKQNTKLESLHLENNNIGNDGASALADALKQNTALRCLWLSHNLLGEAGAAAIAMALHGNNTIVALHMDNNRIGDLGSSAIAMALNGSPTFVGFANCGISEVGTRVLAQVLKRNSSLTTLHLDENEIGSVGVAYLSDALKENKKLDTLYLNGCSIDNDGALTLAEALKRNTTLKKLSLKQNSIADEGANAILRTLKECNTTLALLDLAGNNISPVVLSEIHEIVRANSDCVRLRVHPITPKSLAPPTQPESLFASNAAPQPMMTTQASTPGSISLPKTILDLPTMPSAIGSGAEWVHTVPTQSAQIESETTASIQNECVEIQSDEDEAEQNVQIAPAAPPVHAAKRAAQFDVYDGKGQITNAANAFYLSLVRSMAPRYKAAATQAEKQVIAATVYDAVIREGGLFFDRQGKLKSKHEAMNKIKKSLKDSQRRAHSAEIVDDGSAERVSMPDGIIQGGRFFDVQGKLKSEDEAMHKIMKSLKDMKGKTHSADLVADGSVERVSMPSSYLLASHPVLPWTNDHPAHPTADELENMINECSVQCETLEAQNKIAPLPLRERWLQLNNDLARERAAKARGLDAVTQCTNDFPSTEGRTAVLSAWRANHPTDPVGCGSLEVVSSSREAESDVVAAAQAAYSGHRDYSDEEPVRKALCDQSRQRKSRGADHSALVKGFSTSPSDRNIRTSGEPGSTPGGAFDFVNSQTHVDLGNRLIGNGSVKQLARLLSSNYTTVSLCLNHNMVGPEGASALATALAENKALKDLDLGANFIGDGGAKAIAIALETNSVVASLDLSMNSLGSDAASEMSRRLRNNTAVENLLLSGNFLGPIGAESLRDLLKHNTTLKMLDVGSNMLGSDGASALAEALKVNATLSHLDLGTNAISDCGAIRIAKAVKLNAALTKLNLSNNKIGTIGACSLSDALDEHTSLTYLDLAGNTVGPHGATALALGLRQNASLTHFNLNFNDIGCVGAIAFADALKTNGSLANLHLEGNSIGSQGAQAFQMSLGTNTILTKVNLRYNDFCNDDLLALKGVCAQSGLLLFLDEHGQ